MTDAKVDLLDEKNPYGQVKSCILVVRELLVSEKEKTLLSGVYGTVDDGRYEREGHDLWFLPTMRSREQGFLPSMRSRSLPACPVIHGLLLQRHRRDQDDSWSYYRVGKFQAETNEYLTAALESASRRSLITLV